MRAARSRRRAGPRRNGVEVERRITIDRDVLRNRAGEQARVFRVKGTYTFTSRLFARAIAQYVSVDRDPSLYYKPVPAQTGTFGGSALLAYKLNWQSVMFVGYGDDRELAAIAADQARRLAPLDRQVFVKVSYAFQR